MFDTNKNNSNSTSNNNNNSTWNTDDPNKLNSDFHVATSEVLQKIKSSVFPPGHFGPGIEEDILLSEDDFPNLKVGDILEIGQTDLEHEDERPRLLLRVRLYLNLLVEQDK